MKAKKTETHRVVQIKIDDYKKIRKLAFEMEIPMTQLIGLMLKAFEDGIK